jgi:predicted amidohydrolase YtcJ
VSSSRGAVVLADVELPGGRRVDVRLAEGRVCEFGDRLRADTVIDAQGGALLPGLHDHHCHLLATAALERSVRCGPPHVHDRAELAVALRRATPTGGWLRGTGYDAGVAGDLDRDALDALRRDVAVRVQHRSGALWVFNSAAIELLDDGGPRLERDAQGRPTGRLWRGDGWLRDRLRAGSADGSSDGSADGLESLSRQLAAYGVTGVTDATPDLDDSAEQLLAGPEVRQRLLLLGGHDPRAPRKIVVSDHELPALDALAADIARTRPRRVAIHSVTRASLFLALAALEASGPLAGDRIEHAAVAPPEAIRAMAQLGLAVVTQPSLVFGRGDDYLDRVEADDRPALWPYASLIAAGIPVGCSSDAPYGDLDPWAAIRTAGNRRTVSGRVVTADEAVPTKTALDGYLSDPRTPGGRPRSITVGSVADLVVLDRPLADALARPSADHVLATLIDGELVYGR